MPEAIPTNAQAPAQGQPNAQVGEHQQEEGPGVTPQAEYPHLRGSKARVEFRDQHGNVLDENLVSSLRSEGKVSFETRYETNTLLEHGHEVDIVDGKVAPPHPDVQGQNPETIKEQGRPADDSPPSVPGGESAAGQPEAPEAKPASEGNEATRA